MGDSAIVAVDLVSGDRTILSGPSVGSGPTFSSGGGASGIVVDGMRALVLDRRALLAVDLATGDRTISLDLDTGTGPVFSIYRLETALDGDRLLVSDSGLGAVLALDLVSGDRTILSDPSTGGGPRFSPFAPNAIVLDETDPSRALVVDSRFGAVVAVDLASGERSLVSASSVGMGPALESSLTSYGIWLEEERALVGGGREASLVAVDLATGDRTILSGPSNGSGPAFIDVRAIVVDGGRALALARHDVHPFPEGIFAVDLASGDRSILSDSSTGAGPELCDANDIALAGREVLVAGDGLMAVDLASGDRRLIPRGQGPRFEGTPVALVVDGNRAIVVDGYDERDTILSVDLTSGDRAILSAIDTRGEGPNFKNLTDVVLDGERVLVGRSTGGGIYAVDLATGDRTLLSDSWTVGAGPGFTPGQIARNGDRVWVRDSYLQAILAFDPRSGQRTIVAR
jgi:hypothetical protein